MLNRKLFKNARLLDPSTGLDQIGSVLIRDGKIEDIGPKVFIDTCLLYTSPSPRDVEESRMPSSA